MDETSLDSNKKRFIIQELWNLGDIVHALPLAQALQSKFPDSEILWICQTKLVSTAEELIPEHLRKTVFGFDAPWVQPTGKYNLFKYSPFKVWSLWRELKKFSATAAFDIRGDLRSNFLLNFLPAEKRLAFLDPRFSSGLQKLFYSSKTRVIEDVSSQVPRFTRAQELGRALYPDLPKLKPALKSKGAPLRANSVLWHPGARFINRAVSAETVRSTLEFAAKQNLAIDWTLALGPSEVARFPEGTLSAIRKFTKIITPSVAELAAAMDNHEVVIACDSGPLHLASALNKKTVGIFFFDTLAEWGPFSDKFQIVFPSQGIRAGSLRYKNQEAQPQAEVSPSDIVKAVQSLMLST